MGKINTETEAMEHIAAIVSEITSNITAESSNLLKTINTICEKTTIEINRSERQISDWENEIDELEDEIASYESMEDEDCSYQSQIAACQSRINELRSKIRKERHRNNELRQTLSKFRQQGSQALQTVKQVTKASDTANTSGKQFISKKANIISSGYNKNVVGGYTSGNNVLSTSSTNGISNFSEAPSSNQSNTSTIQSFKDNTFEAQLWGEDGFSQWNNSLSIMERQALVDYKKECYPHEASYYVNINNALRGREDFTNGNQTRAMRIHSALSRASVPEDVIAYRGITRDAYNSMITAANQNGSDGLLDNAFMSCSLVTNNAFTCNRDVIMRLTIPEGSHGAYIGNVGNDFASECEILLDCGSSIFITSSNDAPRSTITGNPMDTDVITIIDGVVET